MPYVLITVHTHPDPDRNPSVAPDLRAFGPFDDDPFDQDPDGGGAMGLPFGWWHAVSEFNTEQVMDREDERYFGDSIAVYSVRIEDTDVIRSAYQHAADLDQFEAITRDLDSPTGPTSRARPFDQEAE